MIGSGCWMGLTGARLFDFDLLRLLKLKEHTSSQCKNQTNDYFHLYMCFDF